LRCAANLNFIFFYIKKQNVAVEERNDKTLEVTEQFLSTATNTKIHTLKTTKICVDLAGCVVFNYGD
jgi:hypothetical protein